MMLFALWLLSQTLGFALPTLSAGAGQELPRGLALEQTEGSDGYNAGVQLFLAYDVQLPPAPPATCNDLGVAALATCGYDHSPIFPFRKVGCPRAPTDEKVKFLTAKSRLNVASGAGGNIGQGQIIRMISKGESVAGLMDEAKALTFSTGNEVAVVSLQSGGWALVSGGPGGINLTELGVKRVLGHTHPYGGVGPAVPSPADFNALQQLGQRHSYILERGELIRINAP